MLSIMIGIINWGTNAKTLINTIEIGSNNNNGVDAQTTMVIVSV